MDMYALTSTAGGIAGIVAIVILSFHAKKNLKRSLLRGMKGR